MPATLQEQCGKKKRRPAGLEMTVGAGGARVRLIFSQGFWSFAGGVEDAEDFDGVGADAVGEDVGCAGDD